jgi:ARC6-like, IMS domain
MRCVVQPSEIEDDFMRLTSMPQKAVGSISGSNSGYRRIMFFCLSITLTASAMSMALPALAVDDASSMDSIWVDQSVKDPAQKAAGAATTTAGSNKSGSATAPPTAVNPPPNLSAAPEGTSVETTAPMCTVGTFKDSALFTGNGWSGIGPFKAGADNSEYTDGKQNRIRLELSGDLITHAELTLSHYQPVNDPVINMLNMLMNIDFFLESVGLKPSRIQNVNVQIDRNKETVLSDSAPLNITTGRYAFTMEKRPLEGGRFDCIVAVNSLDADKKIIKHPWVSSEPKKETSPPPMKVTTALPETSSTSTSPAPAADRSQLKAQFVDLINNWQKIKKEAVKSRQPEQLSAVLAGKALVRQTDAVKWLITNHKYYDMNPKGAVIDQYTEILPSKKYMVAAQVHEAYKFIDDTTGKTLKEVDDVNKVNYTVEKVGAKWVITDSKLLTPNNATAPNYATRNPSSANNPH